jgi:uncharacterized protein (UPF0548 family)
MLGPLLIVPLVLFLVLGWVPALADRPSHPGEDRRRTLLGWFRGGAAIAAALSFIPSQGLLAGVLTIPWLLVACTVGAIGLGRIASRRRFDPMIATDVALVFLIVGASWLTISRVGANPLGFSDTIVLLTAVHFHYAGLTLPVVAGIVASHSARRAVHLIPLAVVIGVPFTALGIMVGGDVEWLAATFMALSGLATAYLLVRYAFKVAAGWARSISAVAGVALACGMGLALGWSWSVKLGWRFLDVDMMARTHGSLNAFGFGLLAVSALVKHACEAGRQRPFRAALHLGSMSSARLAQLREDAEHETPVRNDVLFREPTPHGYRRTQWSAELPNGFDDACTQLRQWSSHRAAGVTVEPSNAALVPGQTVSLSIPILFVSMTATCRIVAAVNEPNRFGFTYATLPHHPEEGEESFLIERRPDGSSSYTITAVSRPAMFCTRLVPPLSRWLQSRIANKYLHGVSQWQSS